MNKCKKCGKMVSEEAIFCENCGQKQAVEGKYKKTKKLFIFSGLAFIILLIGGFTYSSYENKIEESKISEAKTSVASLFDSEKAIKKGIIEKDILRADIKIDRLKKSKVKNRLNIAIKMASKMATIDKQLNVLASNDTLVDEKEGIKELERVKKELVEVKEYSPSFYNHYSDKYKVVHGQYKAQENLRNELNLAQLSNDDEVTKEVYDNLVSQNDKIKNLVAKENFAVLLDEMKNKLEEKESEKKDRALAKLEEKRAEENESAFVSDGEEIETVSLNYNTDSFIGIWTVDNQIISIDKKEMFIGTQQSDNAVFAEIESQSFDPSTHTLTMSIITKANEMNGTLQGERYVLEFIIKEIDKITYIENQGKNYIKNG